MSFSEIDGQDSETFLSLVRVSVISASKMQLQKISKASYTSILWKNPSDVPSEENSLEAFQYAANLRRKPMSEKCWHGKDTYRMYFSLSA